MSGSWAQRRYVLGIATWDSEFAFCKTTALGVVETPQLELSCGCMWAKRVLWTSLEPQPPVTQLSQARIHGGGRKIRNMSAELNPGLTGELPLVEFSKQRFY